MLDCIIRNGTVIDGTGAPGVPADVGIQSGRIVSIGRLNDPARRTVDADGLVVAPGFIDIHTHYDAQVHWDGLLTPSNLHGVTSIIGGNCGFSLAPIAPEHVGYLTRMLARVEGIPLEALQAGLDFQWASFGDYLSRLDGHLAINAGFLVGHSTIRRVVMRERATGEQASPDELRRMCELLHECLAQGALGFSSTWHPAHHDGEGNPVPSRFSTAEELIALAAVARPFPGSMLQFTPGSYGVWGERETDVMINMSLAAGAPINWNPARVRETDPDSVERQLLPGTMARARGASIVALHYPFPSSSQLSLSQPQVYDTIPGWRETMYLPLAERMRAFADPAQRRRLADCALRTTQRPATHAVNWGELCFERVFAADLQHLVGKTVGEVARETGKSAFDAYLDVALADQLRTYVSFPIDPDDDASWQLRVKMMRDPRAILGGSDAGAHVDSICNATMSTRLLGETVRQRGLLSLEEAIHLITDMPARFYGLAQRGRVQAGWHADLVVFDPATVSPRPAALRHDFPAGTARLYAEANGICNVIVNGVEVMQNGVPTGEQPGTVLRSTKRTDGDSN